MAILESVRELASKLGAETNGRDITDQLNKINKHLDKTALSGRDIAEAVKTYSENASGGGGGGETFEVEITVVVTPLEQGTSGTFTTSKTIQETIDAIKAGKQIVFSATWNEREANIVCYAAYNNGSFGEAICMWIYDEQTICPIIWMTDNDTFMVENIPAIFVF